VLVELVVLAAGILFARWAGQVVRPASDGPARPARPRVRRVPAGVEGGGRGRARTPPPPLRRAAGAVLRKVAHNPTRAARRLAPGPGPPASTCGALRPHGGRHRPGDVRKTLDVVAHAVLAAPGAVVQWRPNPTTCFHTGPRGEPVAVFDPLGNCPDCRP